MSDNTTLNSTSGGDTIRSIDRTSAKTQIVGLDFGGESGPSGEQLVSSTNPLPVSSAGISTNISLAALGASTSFTNTGFNTLGIQLSVVPNGSIVGFFGSNDNVNFAPIEGYGNGGTPPMTTVSQPGGWWFNIGGVHYIQLVCTSYTGPISGVMFATQSAAIVNLATGIGQQNSANSLPVVLANDQVIFAKDLPTLSAQTQEQPLFTALTGDPSGDFAGVNLLETLMDTNSSLGINVNISSGLKKDPVGAIFNSDMAGPFTGFANQNGGILLMLDTTGYSSLVIQAYGTWSATVVVGMSNDGITWTSSNGMLLGASNATLAIAANGTYIYPCYSKYTKVYISAYTSGEVSVIAYLRNITMANSLGINPSVSISSGTVSTVSALTALNGVSSTNGQTIGTQISPTTPSALSIKGSAGRLYYLHVGNPNSSAVYVKIFNATSVTLGTTSATMNFYIAATNNVSLAINDCGLYFSTGIQLAITGGASLTDNTVITTGCEVNYSFI